MDKRAPAQTRDVGTMGEDAFRNWCSRNSLSVVPSNPDRMGWDFLVEFEPEADSEIPRDRQNVLKKAFIQVKSSDRGGNAATAKLSALKRLVDSTLPSFIVYLNFNRQSDPVRARLLHIGNEQIEDVLSAVRKAESAERTDFNNIIKSLSLGSSTELAPDGSDILQLLWGKIPEDMAQYAVRKAEHVRTCGYGPGSLTGQFTITSDAGSEPVIDLMIGKLKELRVDNAVMKSSRFGIDLAKDIKFIGPATITITPESEPKVALRVIGPGNHVRAEMEAKARFPSIPGLPPELWKFRISNDFFDCEIKYLGASELTIKIPEKTKFSIHALEQILRFGLEASRPGSMLGIQIMGSEPFECELPLEAEKLASWSDLHRFAELISTSVFRFRRHTDLFISFDELQAEFTRNSTMLSALTNPGISFTTQTSAPVPANMPVDGVLFFPIVIECLEVDYLAVIKAPATVKPIAEGRFKVTAGQPSIVEETLRLRSESEIDQLNKRAAAYGKLSQNKGVWVAGATCEKRAPTL